MSDTVEVVKRMEAALMSTVRLWGEFFVEYDEYDIDPQVGGYVYVDRPLDVSVHACDEHDSRNLFLVFHDDGRGRILDSCYAEALVTEGLPEYRRYLDDEDEALRDKFNRYAKHDLTALVRKTFPGAKVTLQETGKYSAWFTLEQVTK